MIVYYNEAGTKVPASLFVLLLIIDSGQSAAKTIRIIQSNVQLP